jgi:hypothetical protein
VMRRIRWCKCARDKAAEYLVRVAEHGVRVRFVPTSHWGFTDGWSEPAARLTFSEVQPAENASAHRTGTAPTPG